MLERDSLVYLAPEKFATRRNELALKKASKEISIDQSSLVIKDKAQDLTCSTATEPDTTNAMRRRALAFDLVKACKLNNVIVTGHRSLVSTCSFNPDPVVILPSVSQKCSVSAPEVV